MLQADTIENRFFALEQKVKGIERASTGFIKISFLITKELNPPLDAVVEADGDGFIARTTDIPLYGFGDDPIEAVEALKHEIESLYNELMEDDEFSSEWLLIKKLLKSRIMS